MSKDRSAMPRKIADMQKANSLYFLSSDNTPLSFVSLTKPRYLVCPFLDLTEARCYVLTKVLKTIK